MNYPHPVIMLLILALACVALRQGAVRSLAVRFARKAPFPWKVHVSYGKLALAGMFAGVATGYATTWLGWSAPGSTGTHQDIALVIALLAASGLATGFVLDRRKKPGTPLGLAHALGNTAIVLLTLWQAYTGIDLLRVVAW